METHTCNFILLISLLIVCSCQFNASAFPSNEARGKELVVSNVQNDMPLKKHLDQIYTHLNSSMRLDSLREKLFLVVDGKVVDRSELLEISPNKIRVVDQLNRDFM